MYIFLRFLFLYLPIVNIYRFHEKKIILIQPPGEPQEQHLGDVRPKKFKLHKMLLRQNDGKGWMAQFWENCKKKGKNEVTGTDKL